MLIFAGDAHILTKHLYCDYNIKHIYMIKEKPVINMNGGYPKTYADNATNRKLDRVGKPIVRKTSSKTSTKKECPPGKVLSPKGRCVKDRSKVQQKTSSDSTNNLCIECLTLKIGDYDNYGLNGTYVKCLEFSKSGKKWVEPNKKLGFRSEYITTEQTKKHKKNYKKYTEKTLADNKKNLAQWKKKNQRKSIHEWDAEIYILSKEIYILNQSALESETICKNEGNLSFKPKEIPRSNNKIMTDQLSKESCVYCKLGEPNKLIFRKSDKKWYIQDLHKSTRCYRYDITSSYFYKPNDGGLPEDVLFHTKVTNQINPPENNYGSYGFIANKVECLKEPSRLLDKLNLIWDNYEAGKLTRKEHKQYIDNTWKLWINEPYDLEGFELKHKKRKKTLTWAPGVVSPPDSRVKLHRKARKLSDEALS